MIKAPMKTIVFLSSPQEALALDIVSRDHSLDEVYAVRYKGYSSGKYFQTICTILDELKIDYQEVELRNHRISISSGRPVRALIDILENIRTLNQLDKNQCQGELYDSNTLIFANHTSPVFDLVRKRKGISSFRAIEHSPIDELDYTTKGDAEDKAPRLLLRFLGKLVVALRQDTRRTISRMTCVPVVQVSRLIFPYFNRNGFIHTGYSWRRKSGFSQLLYSNIMLDLGDSIDSSAISYDSEKRGLLMIEHPEIYKTTSHYDKNGDLNSFISAYMRMSQRHLGDHTLAIVKPHPFIHESLPQDQVRLYLWSVKKAVESAGIKRVVLFSEIVKGRLSDLPLELFVKDLKVSTVIGSYSCTHILLQNEPGIRVISDCRDFRSMGGLRRTHNKALKFDFEMY